MGKYSGISFGTACMHEKEEIKHALNGEVLAGTKTASTGRKLKKLRRMPSFSKRMTSFIIRRNSFGQADVQWKKYTASILPMNSRNICSTLRKNVKSILMIMNTKNRNNAPAQYIHTLFTQMCN